MAPNGFEHTLALGSLLKHLGIKGGHVPLISDQISPVLVMGAVETLDASPVEARGLAGVALTPPVTQRAGFRLNAIGRPLIIQDVYTAFGSTFEGRMTVHGEQPYATAVNKVEIGGLGTSGVASSTVNNALPASATFFAGQITFPNQRWFIPAGSAWEITSNAVGQHVCVVAIWRELPAPIGGP